MGGFSSTQLFYLGLMVIALGAVVTIVMDITKQDKKASIKNIARNNKHFTFYYDNFFTRKMFRRIYEQLSSLQLYSIVELRTRTVKAYELISIISVSILVFGLITLRDIVSFAILTMFVIIMRDVFIQKKVDASMYDMTVSLSQSLASLSDNYTKYNDIAEAVRVAERAPILDKTFETIYSILTSEQGEDMLNEFYVTQYFPRIKTLASVCYLLNTYGDPEENEGGLNKFKQAVMLIKDEVDFDVRALTKKKLLFGKLEYLPVVPILTIGIIQKFFIGIIPGTSLLYNGVYGFCMRIVLVLLSTYGYYWISNATRAQYIRKYDRFELFDRMLKNKTIASLVKAVSPKSFRDRMKIDNLLKGCLSSQDIPYVMLSKLVYSFCAFVFTILATIIIIAQSRSYIYNSIEMMSFTNNFNYTKEQAEQMRNYDHALCALDELPSDESIRDSVEIILPLADDADLDDQVTRIHDKFNSYKKLIYHWWLVLIVIDVTIAAWYIPEYLLKVRKKLIQESAKEDVLQMQTIICILSATTLDTQEVLYWLSKNSIIHKDHLNFAFHEYTSDPEMSIQRLKRNSVVPEFHQLCDKLTLTCFNINLKEAFIDLIPERNHMMKIREMESDTLIQNKRSKASPISQIPLYATIFGMIVAPTLILGFSQFKQVIGNLQV